MNLTNVWKRDQGTLFSNIPVTLRARKAVYVCRVCIQDQSFNNCENDTMKLSVSEAKLTGLYARNCATIQQVLILKLPSGPKSYRAYRGTGPSKTVANTSAKCYLSFCRSCVLGTLAAFPFFTFAHIITTWCLFDFVSVFRGQENVKGTPRKHSLAFLNVGVFISKVMLLWGIVTIDVLWYDETEDKIPWKD